MFLDLHSLHKDWSIGCINIFLSFDFNTINILKELCHIAGLYWAFEEQNLNSIFLNPNL